MWLLRILLTEERGGTVREDGGVGMSIPVERTAGMARG